MENATDTLRNEVYSFGISVSLILPGALEDSTSTQPRPLSQSPSRQKRLVSQSQQHQNELYAPISATTRQISSNIRSSTSNQTSLTSTIDHALFNPIPKTKYHLGWDTKVTRWIRWTVSDRFLDFVFQGLVKQNMESVQN